MLVPKWVSMHVKLFSDWIKYGHQGCVKVHPRAMEMLTCTPVDKGFSKNLLLDSNQTFHIVSILWGVNAREIVFGLDPIWLPEMRQSTCTSYGNADLHTCRQRFFQAFVA